MDKRRAVLQKPRNREFVRRVKLRKGCSQCGYKKYHGALHFHHLNPEEKISSGSKAIQYNWSPTKIKREMRKCTILCANCHAEEHWPDK